MALKRWSISGYDVSGTPAVTTKTLLTAAAEAQTLLLSLLISNYSGSVPAHIVVEHKDSLNAVLFSWALDLAATDSPFALDSMITLEPGDYIAITSDIDAVSILASGDEIPV